MIFQALIRRRKYLLTLIASILTVVYSLPVFADASLYLLQVNSPHLTGKTVIVENSNASIQPDRTFSLFQQLDLTEQQQLQIRQIHHQYRQRILKNKKIVAKLQQQLSDMMVGAESVELLRAKNHQLNTLLQETRSLRFESMLATREILTLEQRLKFRELVKLQLAE